MPTSKDISDAYEKKRLVQEPNGGYLANAKACQDRCVDQIFMASTFETLKIYEARTAANWPRIAKSLPSKRDPILQAGILAVVSLKGRLFDRNRFKKITH